jgi:hypothetical protein
MLQNKQKISFKVVIGQVEASLHKDRVEKWQLFL